MAGIVPEEEVTLRDGARVLIRPVQPGDKALFAHAESGEGVGVARYVRLSEQPAVAEAAVSVVDDWQGRGLGGELLRRLTSRAREHGVERFQASLFAFNHSMLAPFEDIGEVEVRDRGMGQIEIDVELPCDRARGIADALPAAAQGLVRLRP